MISLLLSVFSHVSSDFVFQTDNICKNRLHDSWSVRIKANFKHSRITWIMLFLLLATFYSSIVDILIFSIIIAACHFLIDCTKSFLCKYIKNGWTSFIAFFIDQFIHLFVIVIIWTSFDFRMNWISMELKKGINTYILNYYGINSGKYFTANILIFLILFIYVTFGGDVIVKNLLLALRVLRGEVIENNEEEAAFQLYKANGQSQQKQTITQTAATKEPGVKGKSGSKKKKNKRKDNKEENKALSAVSSTVEEETAKEASIEQVTVTAAKEEENNKISKGKYIGILERIIIMLLTINNSFTSIAFVLTAKSIVRSKKIENEPGFAEEYLIGTLSSILIAILGGCAFNLLHINAK